MEQPSPGSQSKIKTSPRFSKIPETPPTPLHVFVTGPSERGKSKLIELFANRKLEIPISQNVHFSYRREGFLLQGINAQINIYHVGNIEPSLEILRFIYQRQMTSFIMVYDAADPTTFDDIRHWIPSLRAVLDNRVPIVLVGFEDSKQMQTAELLSVSYSNGMNLKSQFNLDTFYQMPDTIGSGVAELFFEAAQIALERKLGTSESALVELEEMNDSSKDSQSIYWN